MRRLSRVAGLIMLLAVPATAAAQGSGSTNPRSNPNPRAEFPEANPYAVTRWLKGTVENVDQEKGTLVVVAENGERYTFEMHKNTKFKADKDTELAGQKNLKLSDFTKGFPVRVTYRSITGEVTEVRLRHVKKS